MSRYAYQRGKPSPWPVVASRTPADARHLWEGLSLAWPCWDVRQRQLEDVSGNRLHGVFGSSMLAASDWAVGEHGPGIVFRGIANDIVTVADPASNLLDGTANLSVEIVFSPVGITGLQGLIGKYYPAAARRGWRLYMDEDELAFQVSSDGANNEIQRTTAANLVAGGLYHVVVTYSSGVFVCYVNGVASANDGDFGTAMSIFGAAEPLLVGQRTDASALTGDIYGIRIWTGRTLTASDVRQLTDSTWRMYEQDWGTLPSMALEDTTGPVALVGSATLTVTGVTAAMTTAVALVGSTALTMACGTAAISTGGETPAGPWILAAEVYASLEEHIIGELTNGVEYDVQLFTVDVTGNISAGSSIVSGTPFAIVVPANVSKFTPVCGGKPHPLLRRL
ncbi:MAG: LamG-like jellyroll fold domain-containing protein [Pseudomonadota bacterium]